MLVLSRKRTESVLIRVGGVEIELEVLDTSTRGCRLGFRAPSEAYILRRELVESSVPACEGRSSLREAGGRFTPSQE